MWFQAGGSYFPYPLRHNSLWLALHILLKIEANSSIYGVKVSCHNPTISHLVYADDLLIFYKADQLEHKVVIDCINKYYHFTGQLINCSKSSIHFSKNVLATTKEEICSVIAKEESNHKTKYLSNQFCKDSSKREAFKGLVEKVKEKLGGWRKRALSQVGRTIFIKSVV